MTWSSGLEEALTRWLQEDVGQGDITCERLFRQGERVRAHILFKEEGVAAGLDVARRLFSLVDESVQWQSLATEGAWVTSGTRAARIEGRAQSILTPERLALNLVGHLSGVATLARRFVEKVQGLSVEITETRKTTPGMRRLEKYATCLGGMVNHRMGLYDQVLIKDNHLAALRAAGFSDPVSEALRRALSEQGPPVEIEVDSPEDGARAARAGAGMILLDNMTVPELKRAVQLARAENPAVILEASGGVDLETVRSMAETGVDRISVGKVTHSAKSLDVSLEVEPSV